VLLAQYKQHPLGKSPEIMVRYINWQLGRKIFVRRPLFLAKKRGDDSLLLSKAENEGDTGKMWGDALHLCKWHVQPLVLLLLLQCAVVAYILIMRLVLCYTYFTLLPFHISSQQRATRNPRGTCPTTQPISQPLYHPTHQTTDHPSFASLHCLHVKWVRGLTRTQRPSFVRGGWFKKKGGGSTTTTERCVKFDFILDK